MLKNNILANLIGRGWSIISVYLFIPVYVKWLGLEGYAIVSFYTTLTSILLIVDGGLTATISRELSKHFKDYNEGVNYKKTLVYTIEKVLFLVAAVLIVVMVFFSETVAINSLKSDVFALNELSYFVKLMGIAAVLQFLTSFYFGGLNGLEKQVVANGIQFFWSLLRSVGAISILWLVEPTVENFLLWQIFSNLVYLLILRFYLCNHFLQTMSKPRFDSKSLKLILHYALGIFFITLASAINLQADKLIISYKLNLEALAVYSLAYALGQAPLVLSTPISTAFFPRLTHYATQLNDRELFLTYLKAFNILGLIVIPLAVMLFFFSKEFIFFWTGSMELALRSYKVSSILIVGSLFLSFQVPAFNLALSKGNTKISLGLSYIFSFTSVALYIMVVSRFQLEGVAYVWALLNLIMSPLFIYVVNRKFAPTVNWQILKSVMGLLLISTVVFGSLKFSIAGNLGFLWLLFLIGLSFFVIVFLFFSVILRKSLKEFLKEF